jgi:hypothetical protein
MIHNIRLPITFIFFYFLSLSSVYGGDEINSTLSNTTNQRLALVIGNARYKVRKLSDLADDVVDVSKALEDVGFKVTLLNDADIDMMFWAIKNFSTELSKSKGVGLFYYAGHATQINGRNYLIPINANIRNETEVESKAIKVGLILRKMYLARNEMNMIFLDACRDEAFSRNFRSSHPGLASIKPLKGSLIAYAATPNTVEESGNNGIFARNLSINIRYPGIEIIELLSNVRSDVRKETGNKQVTWDTSALKKEFYFVGTGKKNSSNAITQKKKAIPKQSKNAVTPTNMAISKQSKNSSTPTMKEIPIQSINALSPAKQEVANQSINLKTDRNIIIYNRKYSKESQVDEKHGELEIEIYSINPIINIQINNQQIDFQDDRQAKVKFPFTLTQKINDFNVTVITNQGIQEEDYRIFYQDRIAKLDSFRIATILKQTQVDNVQQVPQNEDKDSTSKTTIIVIPKFSINFNKTSDLELQAILLREKYQNSLFKEKEVVYSQLAGFLNIKDMVVDKLSIGIGSNDISSNNENYIQGEVESASEVFVVINGHQSIMDTLDLKLNLKIKTKDAKIEHTNKADEEDGRVVSSNNEIVLETDFGKFGLLLGLEQYDAFGDNKDTTTSSYGFRYSIPIGALTPYIGYSIKNNNYKNEDTLTGVKQNNITTTAYAQLNYNFLSNLIFGLSYHNISQTSNIEDAEYSQNKAELMLMVVF